MSDYRWHCKLQRCNGRKWHSLYELIGHYVDIFHTFNIASVYYESVALLLLIGPLWANSVKYEVFHSRKCIWKCRENGGHFLFSGSICDSFYSKNVDQYTVGEWSCTVPNTTRTTNRTAWINPADNPSSECKHTKVIMTIWWYWKGTALTNKD